MKIDLVKAEQASAELVKSFNTDIKETLEDAAGLIRNCDESEILEQLTESCKKVEDVYNAVILPYLDSTNKVVSEQLPELDSVLKKLEIGVVTDKTVDRPVGEIDTASVSMI